MSLGRCVKQPKQREYGNKNEDYSPNDVNSDYTSSQEHRHILKKVGVSSSRNLVNMVIKCCLGHNICGVKVDVKTCISSPCVWYCRKLSRTQVQWNKKQTSDTKVNQTGAY